MTILSVTIALSMLAAVAPPAPTTHAKPSGAENEAPRYSPALDLLSQQLAASGVTGIELAQAEYFTTAAGYDAATSQTIVAHDRTHLLNSQFVENDPRRGGVPHITYVVDQSDGGASFILGITFTFVFIGPDGPTDIDNNGLADVAFREIYYNRGFGWGTNGLPPNVDVVSVATHEAGHAFGLAHFGRIFLTKNGTTIDDVKYAPRSMMNAAYVTPYRELTGSDNGAFCQIWANSH